MPCWELFDAQDAAYRRDIVPGDVLTVSNEAGSTCGWARYTGLEGPRFGIDRYGGSTPAAARDRDFGLTAEVISPRACTGLCIQSEMHSVGEEGGSRC